MNLKFLYYEFLKYTQCILILKYIVGEAFHFDPFMNVTPIFPMQGLMYAFSNSYVWLKFVHHKNILSERKIIITTHCTILLF